MLKTRPRRTLLRLDSPADARRGREAELLRLLAGAASADHATGGVHATGGGDAAATGGGSGTDGTGRRQAVGQQLHVLRKFLDLQADERCAVDHHVEAMTWRGIADGRKSHSISPFHG